MTREPLPPAEIHQLDPDPDHARIRAIHFAVAALIGAAAIGIGAILYG